MALYTVEVIKTLAHNSNEAKKLFVFAQTLLQEALPNQQCDFQQS